MLAAAFTSIALLPGLLTPTVAEVKPRTSLPILLPKTFSSQAAELHASGSGGRREYSFRLTTVPNCKANYCFAASFYARKGGKVLGLSKVKLARGRTGRYSPISCGASCAPGVLMWKERGVVYSIEALLSTNKSVQRTKMVKLANEAIKHGPR